MKDPLTRSAALASAPNLEVPETPRARAAGLDAFALALDAIKDELRRELLEELRAEMRGSDWPEYMSVETAARYLDSPVERLRKLQARRRIPFHQEAAGCRVFFSRRDLDEWMDGQRR